VPLTRPCSSGAWVDEAKSAGLTPAAGPREALAAIAGLRVIVSLTVGSGVPGGRYRRVVLHQGPVSARDRAAVRGLASLAAEADQDLLDALHSPGPDPGWARLRGQRVGD
jgi:hypothetical protein